MLYEDLHQRYGSHITSRVRHELSFSEFNQVAVPELPAYLELRAEVAHREYQAGIENPLVPEGSSLDALCRRWREAEDLSYLVTVAEDVSVHARRAVNGN